MIETLFASRLTTTRRVSSEVRAMVVERVGPSRLALFLLLLCAAAPMPTRPIKTTTSTSTERGATRPSSPRSGDDRIKVVRVNLRRFIVDSSSLFFLLMRSLHGNQSFFAHSSHVHP